MQETQGLHACAADEVSSLEYQDRQEPLLDGKELVSPTKTRNGNFALAWNVPLDSHDLALSALSLDNYVCKSARYFEQDGSMMGSCRITQTQ